MFGKILWMVLAALGEKTTGKLNNLLAASSAIRSSIGRRPHRARQASAAGCQKAPTSQAPTTQGPGVQNAT